jgi:hypothetical protein
MVAAAIQYHTVATLMRNQAIEVNELVRSTGICPRIVKAIVHQHYTPSPEQRIKIACALRWPRERIIWGHSIVPEQFAQMRL